MKNTEIRQVQNNINLTGEDSRTVEGYAVIFESESVDMGFTEIIHRGAITDETIKNSDILCKLNHNDEKVLARSKNGEGSLLLEVDDKGLKYMFDAPHTEAGNEVLEYLKRGDITSSSFGFLVSKEEGSERWYKDADGQIHRDIYKIDRLFDVAPVFQPAYEATSCSARYEEMKKTSEEIDAIMDINKKEIENL